MRIKFSDPVLRQQLLDTGNAELGRVASGQAALAEDGTFTVEFLPEADPRKAGTGISYSYSLQVEITDEGGETRTAQRTFRLGFTMLEGTITLQDNFALANQPLQLKVVRHDLDHVPRSGVARWRLVSVAQPAELVPGPADLPAPKRPESDEGFKLPDDDKRPRWDTTYRPDEVMAGWPDGALVGQGQMVHDPSGEALLTLPPLAAGVYRFHYETVDEAGGTCSAQ